MKVLSHILVYRRFLLIVFTLLVLLPLPIIVRTKVSEPGEQAGGFPGLFNCPLLFLCNCLIQSCLGGGGTLSWKSGWSYIVFCLFFSFLMANVG